MPPHEIKRSRGRPRKNKFGGEQEGAGRPTKLNDEISQKIFAQLADGTPFRYACLINGVDFETGNNWCRTNKKFSRLVEANRSIGIEKYRQIATKQGAGWKILKSLDKGKEFSDNISVSFDEDPVEVCNPDGSKDII